jgi:hypothetical protein
MPKMTDSRRKKIQAKQRKERAARSREKKAARRAQRSEKALKVGIERQRVAQHVRGV